MIKIETGSDHKGFGIFRLFLTLLPQFTKDLSDRELKRYLLDNNSAKWFCQFGLVEKTPNFRVFSNARKRIGTKRIETSRLSKIFNIPKEQLRQKGCVSEVFTFIDASSLNIQSNITKRARTRQLRAIKGNQEQSRAIKKNHDKLKIMTSFLNSLVTKKQTLAAKEVINSGMALKNTHQLICKVE